MNYRFYYPEWNNRKEVCKEYPQIKEITREPTAFWYGVGPKRTIRKTKKSIQRLLKRADPYLPILVVYSIPYRDLGHHSKGGFFFGSVPFIYQIHAAPNDYFRFSKQFLESNLKKYGFKKAKVKALGFGPFTASYSLLYPYLKYLPLLSQICLLLVYILDSFIQVFVKTDLKEIFPVGYFFIAKK